MPVFSGLSPPTHRSPTSPPNGPSPHSGPSGVPTVHLPSFLDGGTTPPCSWTGYLYPRLYRPPRSPPVSVLNPCLPPYRPPLSRLNVLVLLSPRWALYPHRVSSVSRPTNPKGWGRWSIESCPWVPRRPLCPVGPESSLRNLGRRKSWIGTSSHPFHRVRSTSVASGSPGTRVGDVQSLLVGLVLGRERPQDPSPTRTVPLSFGLALQGPWASSLPKSSSPHLLV